MLRNHLSDKLTVEIDSRLNDSMKILEETAKRIRDVIADLRPSVLDDYGLMAAIRWYSDQFSKRTKLSIIVQGEEALDRVFAHSPDIVLMDVMLPKMNGIEAARRIKNTVPKTQVVMLSIYEDSAYKADAAAAGESAYIPKRKMGTELIPVITKLLYGQVNTAHG